MPRTVRGLSWIEQLGLSREPEGFKYGGTMAAAMLVDVREQLGNVEPWEYEGISHGGMDFRGW